MTERLGEELARELARLGPGGAIGRITDEWPAAVGAAIARNAWPSRIGRDGTLYVHTVDSVWAFELGHRAGEIAERLRVSGVRFAPGPLPERGSAPADEVERARLQPDSAHLEQGEALAASIEDPELREVVARAAAASLARAASGRVV